MQVFNELQNLFETKKLPNSILISGWNDSSENLQQLENFAKKILETQNLRSYSDYLYLDSHKVADVRKLLERISLKSFRNRVVVLNRAEQLTPESVNTLLKQIEEPPPNTYFIVLTNHEQKLLSTLRSRLSLFELISHDREDLQAMVNEFVSQKNTAKRLNWINKMNEEETENLRQFLKELFIYSRNQFDLHISPSRFKVLLKCFEYLEGNVKQDRVLSYLAVMWK